MIELEQILAPLPLPTFVREYFGRTAVHVPGDRDKLRSVYSLAQFTERLARGRFAAPAHTKAVFGPLTIEGGSSFDIAPQRAADAYAHGATVCVSRIDAVEPALAGLCAHTKAVLGCIGEVGVNAYWSPDGVGFSPHFDARVVTTLQLEGSKTWRFSPTAAVPWPAANAVLIDGELHYRGDATPAPWELQADPAALDPANWQEVTLHPGDVLCLPAGAIHCAKAQGHSLALNLHFNAFDVARFLGELLSETLLPRPQFRHLPPLCCGVGRHRGLDPQGVAGLRSRLDEAIAALTALRDDSGGLMQKVAAGLAAQIEGIGPASRQPAPVVARRVRVAPTLVVASTPDDPCVRLHVHGDRIELQDEAATIARAALGARAFALGELQVAGLDPDDVLAVTQSLLELGVLHPVSEHDLSAG